MRTASAYTDEKLFEKLKLHDAEAFSELYRRYYADVYRYLKVLLKDPVQAEDSLQEVFLKLLESAAQVNLQGEFRPYLFRMCHNKAIDTLEQIARDRRKVQAVIAHYALNQQDTADAIQKEQMEYLLKQAVHLLTPQQRAVYECCKLKGMSYEQAGAQLGLSAFTVKEHMRKAYIALRSFVSSKREFLPLLLLLKKILQSD